MTGKRVAAYVRQSQDERGDALSIGRQRDRIEEECRRRGWELVTVYADLARSAANGKSRPELNRMMAHLGDVDVVMFTKLDRFARSVSHLLKLVDETQAAGVQLVGVDDEIDTTRASGRAMMQMRGVFAELELETTRERYQSMVDAKRTRDEWIGKPPFGWTVKDKHLVAVRSEQAALRKAARTYVRGGTYAEAAEILGVSAPSVARRILMTPRVQAVLGDLGDQLAEALRSRRTDRVRVNHRSMLGGIARCEICQGPLRRSSTRAGREGRWYSYRCPETGHAAISGPWLEEFVSAAVLDAIDPTALAKRMRERQRNPKAAELAALEQRIAELEDWAGDGTLSKAAFVRQRDRVQARIGELGQADDDAPELPLDIARNLAAYWPAMTTLERRDVVRALVRRVVVAKAPPRSNGHAPTDDRVEIEWRA